MLNLAKNETARSALRFKLARCDFNDHINDYSHIIDKIPSGLSINKRKKNVRMNVVNEFRFLEKKKSHVVMYLHAFGISATLFAKIITS